MKTLIKNKYGQTPNDLLNDPNISMKAKGLYGYIQSKPEDWNFSAKNISYQTKDGIESITSGLTELVDNGYLKRVKYQNYLGHWKMLYILTEHKGFFEMYNSKVQAFIASEKKKPNTENPESENPMQGNPTTENTQTKKESNSNKDLSNKEKENNVPTSVGTSSEKNIDDYFYDSAGGKTVNAKKIIDDIKPKKEKPLKRAAAVSKKLYNQFESVEDAMATFYKYNPDHVQAAFDLHKVILKNMNRLQVPTKQRETGKVEPDINDIRKLFDIDGATKEQFDRALKNLDGHKFWDKNVQSASKFREKFNQLAALQKEPTEKNAKSNSTEPTIKALNHDYIPPSY